MTKIIIRKATSDEQELFIKFQDQFLKENPEPNKIGEGEHEKYEERKGEFILNELNKLRNKPLEKE